MIIQNCSEAPSIPAMPVNCSRSGWGKTQSDTSSRLDTTHQSEHDAANQSLTTTGSPGPQLTPVLISFAEINLAGRFQQ